MVAVTAATFEWAVAEKPFAEYMPCGDHHVVVPLPNGALIMVVDGLGHGEQAALAARVAVEAVSSQTAAKVPLRQLVQRCHSALRGSSRGVVLSVAIYNAKLGTITWLGVGNVEGRVLLRNSGGHYLQESLLLRPGIVGRQLPSLQASVLRVNRSDLLIFATDGISTEFAEDLPIDAHVDDIAGHIVARYGKRMDDALVLVMRCLGHADAE